MSCMTRRFTLDGSDGLERHLARIGEEARRGVQAIVPEARLEGILLGGGYGRGEGGVLNTPQGDQPYNDLEFYICARGARWLNEARFGASLHKLAEELTRQAGVEVEFKIWSVAQLRREPVTMFSYDLVVGHRQFYGPENLLDGCEQHRAADCIPMSEATRLLMNRCSGLLFALEQLQRRPFTRAHADFVRRNLAKAQLSFGDVVLTVFGQYHSSCRERHVRLNKIQPRPDMPWLAEVRQEHAAGVEFKLHPCKSRASAESLLELHGALSTLGLRLWLWLESRRLQRPFTTAREYALSKANKCPEKARWRNLLINFRRLGPSTLLHLQSVRYPRERLFRALVLLLWEPSTLNDPKLLRQVQSALQTMAASFPKLVAAYANLWRHFN
jgi:hypothetical protein